MGKSIDELWEDIQFDKQVKTLVEERKVDELMKLLANGGLEKLIQLTKEKISNNYRIWEILNVIPEPPIPQWEDKWEDGEKSEAFTVSEWERLGKDFCKRYHVTRIQPFTYNGKLYLRVYYPAKIYKRVLANINEIKKWISSLTEEQKSFIIKLYDLVMDRNFEKEVWFNNGNIELTLVECYWKLWKRFKPEIYRPDEVWEDDHDREPYGHWVR